MLPVFRTSYKVAKKLRQGGIVIRIDKRPRKYDGESMNRPTSSGHLIYNQSSATMHGENTENYK